MASVHCVESGFRCLSEHLMQLCLLRDALIHASEPGALENNGSYDNRRH
jgi:hypothetical protein